ncbi:MAG: hypothetical protein K0R61_58 [Microvirga sp.]|jgi:hypothetical protein|nr:hypothetical protein [Microvirga sp.]MDF2969608.1 hypothetical protein [Microvirga sp.]
MDTRRLMELLREAETALRALRTEVEKLHKAEPPDPLEGDALYDAMGDRLPRRHDG